LFLAENVHSQFVLLAFYSHPDDIGRAFLRQNLSIVDLEYVRFVINRPSWAIKTTGDRFWGTTGVPRDMLELLDRLSVATTKTQRKIPLTFRREKTIECWNFMLDREGFQQMAAAYESPQDLFKALESTHISDLLFELMVDVKIEDVDGSVSHRELSEGEQQLLLVLGLLRFTKQDDAIFLLDEPDTHLNPAWSVQFLRFIEQIVGAQPSNHIIMATHDPLVFGGLTKEQVRIMTWSEAGDLVAIPPHEEPRGMGFDAILTSELFGLRAALDLQTLEALDERRQLTIKHDKSDMEQDRLTNLNRDLEALGFSIDNSDPVFAEFEEDCQAT
jgi:predicted ATPase